MERAEAEGRELRKIFRKIDAVVLAGNFRKLQGPYSPGDAHAFITQPPPPEDFAVVIGGKAVGGIGLAPGTDVGRFNAGIGCRIGASYRGLVPGTGCYDRRRGAGRGAGFRKYPDNSYLCRRIRLESRFAAGAGQSRIPFRGDDAPRFCRERSVRGWLLL